jgi:pyruvate carboxylase
LIASANLCTTVSHKNLGERFRMAIKTKKLGITEVVLRDAHQSILATRIRIDDMLPICAQIGCHWLLVD